MLKYKVRLTEAFHDGSIFGAKHFRATEEAILTENEMLRARSSGAMFDVLETLVPNPLKKVKADEPEQVLVSGELSVKDVELMHPEDTPAIAELGKSDKLKINVKPKASKKNAHKN